MYLRECLIENIGPIISLDVSLAVNSIGNPNPVILVGKNGTGKTIFLAYVLDALAELAKIKFSDVVVGQRFGHLPFLKMTSGGNIRSLSGTSLSLLEFSNSDNHFYYIEKVGTIDPNEYTARLRGRFESVKSWPKDEPFHKQAIGDEKRIEIFFQTGSVCFFPSSRHERPHWLNVDAVDDKPLFGEELQIQGLLKKPLVIERAAESNRQWLMDVLLDSLVDWTLGPTLPSIPGQTPNVTLQVQANIQDKLLLQAGRRNVEQVLRSVLEDKNAKLVLNYRNAIHGRVAIRLKDNVIVPSLAHLSAGQALLFNLFATIIRYADRGDLNKSIRLHEIEGIVLVDEIDAHLHTDLQYEVLPRLIKLFPKVQFVVTSHAPLFLLGMEREFGADGIQILEMPTGRQISTERFEEFRRSFEYYRQTRAFEEDVERQVLATSKPLVLTEGQTDVSFIRTGLALLGHTDLLEDLEIDEVGKSLKNGTRGGGHSNLDAARKFLENNQDRFPRRVLLLYDCDKEKIPENIGAIMVRSVPMNPLNTKVTKGIENLFPLELFEDRFYDRQPKPTGEGDDNLISKFLKTEFCDWVCQMRRQPDDFQQFDSILVPILREFHDLSHSTDRLNNNLQGTT